MDKFEFKSFTLTPEEKHVGVAEIKINGDVPMIVRFKIISRKDSTGYFPATLNYKIPSENPIGQYQECFMLDSRSDHDACVKLIMHHVNAELKIKSLQQVSAQQNMSLYAQQAQHMPQHQYVQQNPQPQHLAPIAQNTFDFSSQAAPF